MKNHEIETQKTTIGIQDERYLPFREVLDEGQVIFSAEPRKWWRQTYRLLNKLDHGVNKTPENYPSEMVSFVETYGKDVIAMVRSHAKIQDLPIQSEGEKNTLIAEHAQELMHDISEYLMEDEPIEESPMEVNFLPMEELLTSSERFRLEKNGDDQIFKIYSEFQDRWYDFPLPRTNKVLHKGGFPRAVMKIMAGAKPELIESELPPNDFDVLALKDKEAINDTVHMGIEPDGVEIVNEFDLPLIMNNRDLDLNGCFIGKEGLVYSTQSLEAARTGKIYIVATKRGIYGSEVFYHEGVRLIKNRGIMRYLKTIAERKAESFEFAPINEQVDFGIYWLVLTKRFMNKENGPELLDRLYYLAHQINQVHEGEENIIDVLDRVHTKYPFFDFDGRPLDKVNLARWLQRKFIKQIDKKYREKYNIPSGLSITRSENDTVPYTVTLRDYSAKDERILSITQELENFMKRSRRRTAEYHDKTEDIDTLADESDE